LEQAGCDIALSTALGLERLISARSRLHEAKPQTRTEVLLRWLDEAVKPGRVVGIGRSGKRLVLVTQRRDGNIVGIREDGRSASFPLQRIGRVYSPIYAARDEAIENAFEEVHERGKDLVLPEPRLRDVLDEETDALRLLDDAIESILPTNLGSDAKAKCSRAIWEVMEEAEGVQRATRQIEILRDQIWQPFEQRARVLASFGYLEFEAEKVTERGRWLADLHVDRPLIVGEALESGLFKTLDPARMAAVLAALSADEDRDYGEIELDDSLVSSLSQFEDVGFRVSSEEWKYGIEPSPELNFSAAGASARWASGADWNTLVRETRAEEGDLFRMLSRAGEALLQIAGLRKAHPEAARIAAVAAETVLREPVR
jgi:superfamily II RNA helicase